MSIIELQNLKEFSYRKKIPKKYEKEILIALSHYPELRNVHIVFSLADHASVPYGTKPQFSSCFRLKKNRCYTITLLEKASYPESEALFKNLSENMRIAVIAHELFHVVQYHHGSFSLVKTVFKFIPQATRRKLERAADIGAIQHGFGEGLLEHANYIRSIPGYVEKRPAINTDYLQPAEIMYLVNTSKEASLTF
jgi:hypothetical protein